MGEKAWTDMVAKAGTETGAKAGMETGAKAEMETGAKAQAGTMWRVRQLGWCHDRTIARGARSGLHSFRVLAESVLTLQDVHPLPSADLWISESMHPACLPIGPDGTQHTMGIAP